MEPLRRRMGRRVGSALRLQELLAAFTPTSGWDYVLPMELPRLIAWLFHVVTDFLLATRVGYILWALWVPFKYIFYTYSIGFPVLLALRVLFVFCVGAARAFTRFTYAYLLPNASVVDLTEDIIYGQDAASTVCSAGASLICVLLPHCCTQPGLGVSQVWTADR